ncbi:hypothetical protein DdX_03567 [Ditylenchus destructor]|uniref:Uncharacterized protein n=1 Tax=Ditylenchus destructor TaxID=166010 RepID=A0AAD4NDW4_9BILA|nr:hypothetical protein DdX_03567 [Ditylenchus destructor]
MSQILMKRKNRDSRGKDVNRLGRPKQSVDQTNQIVPRQMLRVQRSERPGGVVRLELRYVSYERKDTNSDTEGYSVGDDANIVVSALKKLLEELGALDLDNSSGRDISEKDSSLPVPIHEDTSRDNKQERRHDRKLTDCHSKWRKNYSQRDERKKNPALRVSKRVHS